MKETKVEKTITNKRFINVNGKTFEIDKNIPEQLQKLFLKHNPEKAEQMIQVLKEKFEQKPQPNTSPANPPIRKVKKTRNFKIIRRNEKEKRTAGRIARNDGGAFRVLVVLGIIGGLVYLTLQYFNISF